MQQNGILDLLEVFIRKMIHTDEFVFVFVTLIILAIVFLFLNRKSNKIKLYLSIFIAIVSGVFILESVNKLFLLSLALIIPFYLFVQKIEINSTIKSILRIIIGVAIIISFSEAFFCNGGDGSFNLCGIITGLLIVQPLIVIDSIIVLYYIFKEIKKRYSVLVIQTYHNNRTIALLILSFIIIFISYFLYLQSLPKWTGVLHYDRNLGFVIPSWTNDLIISENSKAGITYDILSSYENKKVTIYGTAVSDERGVISASCAANKRNCGFTIIPDKIKIIEEKTNIDQALSETPLLTVSAIDAITRVPIQGVVVNISQPMACLSNLNGECSTGLKFQKTTDSSGKAFFYEMQMENLLENGSLRASVSAENYISQSTEIYRDKVSFELIGGNIIVKTPAEAIEYSKKYEKVVNWLAGHPGAPSDNPTTGFYTPYWKIEYFDKSTCERYDPNNINCVMTVNIDARNGEIIN